MSLSISRSVGHAFSVSVYVVYMSDYVLAVYPSVSVLV